MKVLIEDIPKINKNLVKKIEYQEGGEFEVDDNELENLRAQGYEFDIMEDGGEKKPIVVTDKNDPRLQAYNDSTDLYNYTMLQKKLEKQSNFVPTGFMDLLTTGRSVKLNEEGEKAKNILNKEAKRILVNNKNLRKGLVGQPVPTDEMYGEEGSYDINSPKIKPIGTWKGTALNNDYSNVKPVQPVVYQNSQQRHLITAKDWKDINTNDYGTEEAKVRGADTSKYDIYRLPNNKFELVPKVKKPVQPVVYQSKPKTVKKEVPIIKQEDKIDEVIIEDDKYNETYDKLKKVIDPNNQWDLEMFKAPNGKMALRQKKETPITPVVTQQETITTPKTPIGTINIEGREVPYYSEDELKSFMPYKPTQVGSSKNYTISRFENPLYWEGDKVMDKKTGKPLFRDGGEGEPRKKDFVVPPFNSVVTDLNRQPIDNTSNKQVATSTGIPKKVLEKKVQTQIDAKAYSNAYEENARKERLIDAEKASNTPYTSDNWQEVLARTSQATGDKFRFSDKSNFFDDYINPFSMIGNMAAGVGSIPQDLQQGEYTKAVLALGIPLSAGALGGIGAKSTGQFTNNIVNPLAGFSPGEFASNFSNKMDAAFIHKPVETFNGIINGAKDVIRDKRPFFETFPITKAQKEHIRNLQNVAFKEGNKFAEDWFIKDRTGIFKDIYKNQKVIRPEVEKRILDLYGTENLPKNFLDNASSMFDVDELLITKNAKGINSINNKSNIDYLNQKRSSVGGINADDQSITFRNSGWYYETPQRIKDIAIHEASHSAQKIGSRFGVRPWGEETTKYSPKMNYYTSNPNTEIGREFGEAMTEPGKKYKKVWHSSPNELHSELMVARGRAYDNLVKKQGYTNEEAITKLQDLTDSNIDWLNKEYNLDRFFKPTTSIETKRKLIRALPAITGGIAVGASQQDKKYGGEKRRLKKPSYAEGGEYEVSDKEIQRLKKLGYEFETI